MITYKISLWKLFQSFVLLLIVVISLLTLAYADSKGATIKRSLTCKYFDSLLKNHEKCVIINRGREVGVIPSGSYKDLYQVVFRLLNKEPQYKEAIAGKGGILEFFAYAIDLNEDGIEEIILFPLVLRGASGGGDILVFQKRITKKSSQWHRIGELYGNRVHIEPYKNNGYYNLITHEHLGYMEGLLTRHIFKSSYGEYRKSGEKHFHCEIQSEYPCYHPKPSGVQK